MELIHLLTGKNPVQVLVDAITNSGAREDSTRIGSGGVVRRQAVDVSPLRRVNQAIYLICKGSREASFRSMKAIAECLADEIINAAKVSQTLHSYAEFNFSFMVLRALDPTPSQCVKKTKSRESQRVTDERSVAASSKEWAACASMRASV